uniref:Uncharacterized protein n=1 Tax=Anguilla anguilla TaxID=7936 RepID=A0A0E9XNU1_ANGAN
MLAIFIHSRCYLYLSNYWTDAEYFVCASIRREILYVY